MFTRSKSEIALLEAGLQGNAHAFGTLVERYASLVCAITYSGTGRVDESEELAQETFLRAWKGLGQLKDLSKFRPWLCQIARSTVQNWFRDRKRDATAQAAPLEAADDTPSDTSGPVEVAMTREQQVMVSQALAQIPLPYREPLILFYREEHSTREVARQLGLSENAARQRIARGRSLLREQVAAMVETTIARTRPGKAFKTAVIAAIAGTAVRTGSTGAATAFLGTGAKIALAAAGIVIVTGTIWIHRRSTTEDSAIPRPQAVTSSVGQSTAPAEVPPSAESQNAEAGDPAIQSVSPMESTVAVIEPPAPSKTGRTGEATASRETEAPFEFKPRGVLSGLVTDAETGEPIPNALIQIANRRVLPTRTDANGFYSFEKVSQAGNFSFSVDTLTHVGIQRGQDNVVVHLNNDKQTVQDFPLPRACMVDVWVVDQNGVAIPDATVIATSLADDRARAPGYFADGRHTDPNGYVLLGGIPPLQSDYVITAWHTVEAGREPVPGGHRLRMKYDYAPARSTVRLSDPNVIVEVTIVLEEGRDIPAYVEYADGVPAADVRLSLRPAWWHCSRSIEGLDTAADGTIVFEHVTPGTYEIRRHKPHGSGSLVSRVMQTQLPPSEGEPLIIRIPENSPQTFVAVSGVITFAGSQSLRRVRIEAYSTTGGRVLREAIVQDDGTATFEIDELEPGTYTLTFSGQDMEERVLPNVTAPSSGLAVEMTYVPRPQLRGDVVDAKTGQAIPSFAGRARQLRRLRGPGYAQPDRWTQFEDSQGTFTLDTVGPGIYEVQIQADGYAPCWSEPINTDEPMEVQLSLSGGGTVTGIVVDETGQAITGAKVIPLSRACGAVLATKQAFVTEEGAVETTKEGFALPHVPAGTETLKVTHADYAPRLVKNVAVREGTTTADIEIVLTEGATVEGVVYDDIGRPQSGETLVFQDAGRVGDIVHDRAWQLATAVTDSNGFYRVPHLPERPCYVQRASRPQGPGVVNRVVVPRTSGPTRLDFGGTPILAGAVVVNSVPQTKTRVRLIPIDPAHARTFASYAVTDAQGAFAFNGVIPGIHSIYYRHPGKATAWLRIATVSVADTDVDLGVVPRGISTLELKIEGADASPAWTIQRLFLADVDGIYPAPLRLAERPETPGRPWLMHDVTPGSYQVILERADGTQWRQAVAVESGSDPAQLSLMIPSATGQITGHITGGAGRILTFWREDRAVFGIIRRDPDGGLRIPDLPPGRYAIGPARALVYDIPPLLEFDLGPGESQTIDLDLAVLPLCQMVLLNVQVLDETGVARREGRFWLEGPAGPVDPFQFTAAGHAFLTRPGRQELCVEVPGYRPIHKAVTVEPIDLLTAGLPASVMVPLRRP